MTSKKNGFTLLELLIAAALIGVLALFATQAFRSSASDIRVADAKARALLLLNAAERYYTEYPGAASFSDGTNNENPIPILVAPDRDALDKGCNISEPSVQDLVDCGFLEYRQVARDSSTKKNDGTRDFSGSVDMWFGAANKDGVCVCFRGKEHGRVTDTSTTYCTRGGNFKGNCN